MSHLSMQSDSVKKKISKDKSDKDQRGFFAKLFAGPDRKQSIAKSHVCDTRGSRPTSDGSNKGLSVVEEESKSPSPGLPETGYSVNQS